ncbi:MAG: RNA-binding S4 domain-containing protein [Chromatiales bacterium]
MAHGTHDDNDQPRLDRWLWVARFFKTRTLAQDAIRGGKVEVNGERPKPSRHVQVGDMLRIRRGQFETVVRVRGLSRQRGAASVAAGLYEETPESVARRAAIAAERRLIAASAPQFAGRPSKRDRREIIRFTRKRDA